MFYSAAGWHYPLLGSSVGVCPAMRPFFSCLLSWAQAGMASFGVHFPFRALEAMPCAGYHMDGNQVKPLISPASLVDTGFLLFDCT